MTRPTSQVLFVLLLLSRAWTTPCAVPELEDEMDGFDASQSSAPAVALPEDESGAFATLESEASRDLEDGGVNCDGESDEDLAAQPRCAAALTPLASI